jgi:hypothetical protein
MIGAFFIVTFSLRGELLLAQEKKRIDPKSVVTDYKIQVRPGVDVLVRLKLDDASTITGAFVFRSGEAAPFQDLPLCSALRMTLYEGDEEQDLVEGDDFNFDGFQDLKLLQDINDHLGKFTYCVYLWDHRAGRFRAEPQLFGNPQPDPETKTIFTHDDYFGGLYTDYTYVWRGPKLQLIATKGLVSGSSKPECGFTSFCSKLVNGKMQGANKPTACGHAPIEEVSCPEPVAAPTKHRTRAKQ